MYIYIYVYIYMYIYICIYIYVYIYIYIYIYLVRVERGEFGEGKLQAKKGANREARLFSKATFYITYKIYQ